MENPELLNSDGNEEVISHLLQGNLDKLNDDFLHQWASVQITFGTAHFHALPFICRDEGASLAPLQEWFPKGVNYVPNCQLLQQAQNRNSTEFERAIKAHG